MGRSTDVTIPSDAPLEGARAPGGTMGRFTIDDVIGVGGLGIVLAGRDPELDRRVAIKVLRGGGGDDGARLIREAQAMARVAHPNTVTIYEVGRAGDEQFIAMELVDGMTLRAWLDARPRSWREIVAVFIAAGRGLVAMHAAGLVHRDFKLDNVMVRKDGRPQVGDFGLAGDELIAGQQIVGTPSVMAPEQWRGEAVDARSDQFAFAVSLWTAVFREPPFAGDDAAALRDEVLADRRRPRPSLGPVPSAIAAALDRGLAHDPRARWPALDALLDRLQRALGARRRRAIIGGVSAAIAGAAVASSLLAGRAASTGDPCPAPASPWSETQAAALQASVLVADPLRGRALFAAARKRIDPYVDGWRAASIDACHATRVARTQSDTLFDLRMRCLGHRRHELDATVDAVARATSPEQLERAIAALAKLTSVASCADTERMARELELPASPAARAAAEAIVEQLQQIVVDGRVGRIDQLGERADTAVAAARRLGHAGTLAQALRVKARVQLTTMDGGAEATLRELTLVAASARRDDDEAFGRIRLIGVIGYDSGRPQEGLAMVEAALAAVLRAGDPTELRIDLLRHQAMALAGAGRSTDALVRLDEARAILIERGADRPGSPLAEALADVWLETSDARSTARDLEGAATASRAAIDGYRALLGPDTTSEAIALHNLGGLLQQAGRLDEALVAMRDAVRINKLHATGNHHRSSNLTAIASVLGDQGKWDEAMQAYDEAVALLGAGPAGNPDQIATVLLTKAIAQKNRGLLAEARAGYAEVIAVFGRSGATGANLARAHYNRAEIATDVDVALADYRQAIVYWEAVVGPDSPRLAMSLLGIGRSLILLGQPAEAIAPLDRALALGLASMPSIHAQVESWLARALFESRGDAARARALTAKARAALVALAAKDNASAAAALVVHDRYAKTRR